MVAEAEAVLEHHDKGEQMILEEEKWNKEKIRGAQRPSLIRLRTIHA